jgi:hypothetical protein
MKATRHIHDDVIEAIVRGESVHDVHAPLMAFADQVRALGDEPVPVPSRELTAVLAGRAVPVPGADPYLTVVSAAGPGGRPGRKRMPGTETAAAMTTKVAGLSLLAKLGLGTSLAAAGMTGAGAAGVLPTAANDAVRGAIEIVTPVDFGSSGDTPSYGSKVSADATGESDGEKGVDGQTIADGAPGAAHRPDSAAVDETPGQSGDAGLTRANETPAAPNAPDSAGAEAVPDDAGDPDGDGEPGGGAQPETVPSTVPERGSPGDSAGG